MLGKLNKKDLAARAKKMKEVSQALPTEDLKLKIVVEAAPAPTDDVETYSGSILDRRAPSPQAPSPQAPPPSPPPSRDMVVQEGEVMRIKNT